MRLTHIFYAIAALASASLIALTAPSQAMEPRATPLRATIMACDPNYPELTCDFGLRPDTLAGERVVAS
jgi:hypothetical protein